MVRKVKKTTPKIKIDTRLYTALCIRYAPLFVPILILLISLLGYVKPSVGKIRRYNKEIDEKRRIITIVNRSEFDVKRMREELENFKIKAADFEKRLPLRPKTRLTIETLREITKRTQLKFTSLKPASIQKHELKETGDVFVELPVRAKLRCGYDDLIDFFKKIEQAEQFMKITDLSIKNDPSSEWQHPVEFTISAYSKGENEE
ncbi:MAG: type 4a pilus biogenesis protein PilO [Candidatus Omnitrophota bacterium]